MVDSLSPGMAGRPELQIRQADRQLQALQGATANPNQTDLKKLRKSAQEFESVFLQQVLQAMDQTVDRSDSLLSGGHAEEMFRGMLNEKIALSMSQRPGGSGIGLAEAIYKQMSRLLPNHPASGKSSGTSG